MPREHIGILVQGPGAKAVADAIVEAERLGIEAAWLTTGGIGPDALTIFAAAAARTQRIVMGSAILPTWPRNPVFVAQQAQAIESLAPGRLRLGIGPSTEAAMRPFGVRFRRPLGHLREYLIVLRSLLRAGAVDFEGKFLRARARIGQPLPTPVMASALQPRSYELCGELADGAISWVSPRAYLEAVAVPALRRGAAAAGREAPPLVAHTPVCVEEDPARAREAAQRQIGMYPRFQFYQDMFARAGFPNAAADFSQELVDGLVVYGNEEAVARKLAELAASGIGHVMAMPLTSGEDRQASLRRAYSAVARASEL